MRFTIPTTELRKAPFVGPRGGLWADTKHTITWDPAKHGEKKPTFVAADLISNEKMKSIVARLVALSIEALGKLKAEIDRRKKKIAGEGEGTPVSLMRWGAPSTRRSRSGRPSQPPRRSRSPPSRWGSRSARPRRTPSPSR